MTIVTGLVERVSLTIPKGPSTISRSILLAEGQTVQLTYEEVQAALSDLQSLRTNGDISYVDPAPIHDRIGCNFIVDAANGNGLGLRSLKSQGPVSAVFGHTSTTPAPGNNMPVGFFKVFFSQAFSSYLAGFAGFVSPVTGSAITAGSFVPGTTYVIVSVGTTTNWAAAGVPADVVPAVGVAFVATAAGSGNGAVKAPGTSGIGRLEVVGNANLTINATTNPYIIVQCLDVAGAPAAPIDGSVMGLSFNIN